jgi:hypothetical protein
VINYEKGSQHSTHTYRADGGMQPLVRTFLGRGPDSPKDDEVTMATTADDSRTCWASWRGVKPISLSPTPMKGSSTPSRSGVTRFRGGCPVLAVLKPNRIIHKHTNANCISFHLRVFLGLLNPRDRGRLALYLYRVITLVKEKLSLTWGRVGQIKFNCINAYMYLRF